MSIFLISDTYFIHISYIFHMYLVFILCISWGAKIIIYLHIYLLILVIYVDLYKSLFNIKIYNHKLMYFNKALNH